MEGGSVFLTGPAGRKRKRATGGTVLLEVLLAMALFAISLSFLINSLAQSYRATVYSRDYTDALFEADNLMAHFWAAGMMERNSQQEGVLPSASREFAYQIRATPSPENGVGEWLNEFRGEVSWRLGGKKRAFSWHGFILDAS